MFTIIVPYYNMGEYLSKTLESLSEQTCQLFEVIIVDDGSAERLNYDVSQLIFSTKIIHTPNQGVSVARNIGASFAQFDWLVFLDAGDSFEVEFLQTIKEAIEKHKSCNLFASAFSFIKDGVKQKTVTGLTAKHTTFNYSSYLKHLNEGSYLFHLCSLALSKKLFFAVGGFVPKATHGEDHELILKAIKMSNQCVFCNEYLFLYSLDDVNSATRKNKKTPVYAHSNLIKSLDVHTKEEGAYLVNTIIDNSVINLQKGFALIAIKNVLFTLPFSLYFQFFYSLSRKAIQYGKK
jgi:glycosyltransferase involved in cell wall biosynthesis